MRISDWSSDVCSSDLMSTAEIASDIRIGLPADLGIERLAELRAQLAPTFEMTVLRIDGSAISRVHGATLQLLAAFCRDRTAAGHVTHRSEEHTSELQSLMRISYAVFCLKKKKTKNTNLTT